MPQKILLKRGNESSLPNLQVGEPGLTLDTEDLYIGGVDGNISITDNKIFTVESMNEIKNVKKKKGVIVSLGYYNKGDNEPVYYTIEKTGVADYGSCIAMNNGCYAKAILNGGVTPNTFGINAEAINLNERWTNYLDIVNNTNGLYFKLLGQRYKVTKPIAVYKDMIGVSGDSVLFLESLLGVISPTNKTVNGVSLNYKACVYTTLNPNNPEWDSFSVTIKNIKIECNGLCDIGILATDVTRLTINSVTIKDPLDIGLWCSRAWLSTFERITIYCSNITKYGVVVGEVYGEFTANTNLNFTNVYVLSSGINCTTRPFTFLASTDTNITACASDSCNGDSFMFTNNSEIVINGVSSEAVTYTHSIFNLRNTTLKLNAMNMLMVEAPKLFYLRGTNKVQADIMIPTTSTNIIFFDSTSDTNYLEIMPSRGINRSLSIDPNSTFNNSLVVWKYAGLYGYAKNTNDFTNIMV